MTAECPQPCIHLSAEDAREGRECAEHPCSCDAGNRWVSSSQADELEARARELREDDDPLRTWEQATEAAREFWRGQARESLRREWEEILGWPAVDGREPTGEHHDHCAEHGHAPDYGRPPLAFCARCGEPTPGDGVTPAEWRKWADSLEP